MLCWNSCWALKMCLEFFVSDIRIVVLAAETWHVLASSLSGIRDMQSEKNLCFISLNVV